MAAAIFTITFILHGVHSDTIICDGGVVNDCRGSELSCRAKEHCSVLCRWSMFHNISDHAACRNTVVNCKKGQDCMIRCDAGVRSCWGMTINAKDATNLAVISTNVNLFNEAKIYCPMTGNCNFYAIPKTINRAFFGVGIYAQTGLLGNSINFDCTRLSCLNSVTVHCGINYSFSCLIDYESFTQNMCIGGGVCGVPVNPTLEPTSEPTLEPTYYPTVTPHYLIQSTMFATTDQSTNPSANPTINPTTEPSANPTVEPSSSTMINTVFISEETDTFTTVLEQTPKTDRKFFANAPLLFGMITCIGLFIGWAVLVFAKFCCCGSKDCAASVQELNEKRISPPNVNAIEAAEIRMDEINLDESDDDSTSEIP